MNQTTSGLYCPGCAPGDFAQPHICGATPFAPHRLNGLEPTISLYTIQKCPVCEGRGNVPTDFYSRVGVSTSANAEQCQTCHGAGILKVHNFTGAVEATV
jgi:hypothetical protein